jgi:predicted transcriptional regulator
MPKKRPYRVLIDLNPDTWRTLDELSVLMKKPRATIIRQFLNHAKPEWERIIKALKAIEAGQNSQAIANQYKAEMLEELSR